MNLLYGNHCRFVPREKYIELILRFSCVLLQLSVMEERKIVTVLFADLKDFTNIAEKYDPEDVKEIMTNLFSNCSSIIKKYGGYIEKYIPHVAEALKDILGLTAQETKAMEEQLEELLEKDRGELESVEFDPTINEEYDEKFAKIGKRKGDEEEQDE